MAKPSQKDIAARAYKVWERDGQPAGRETHRWLQAERELGAPAGTPSKAATGGAPAAPAAKPGPMRRAVQITPVSPPTKR